MEVNLEKSKLANSKMDNKPNISSVEPGKDFNKTENQKNTEDKKFEVNIQTEKLKEINILDKKEENIDSSINLKLSVKSKHILKIIFSNLDKKKKLLLIKYNKKYHNYMNINIEDYKKISGKIKIGGINDYGKEYDLNKLTLKFEGYYKNGKKNGKGKEFDENKIFEGEYINGIRNGKGFEYNNNKRILFVGEYLNGKKWKGIIKEYYDDSNQIKFDGEYLNGNKIGKEYNINGYLIFEGEYLENKKWNGKIYNNNGIIFEIKNGNGKVKEYDEYGALLFEGEYINGDKNGKEYDKKLGKLIFEGEYLNGEKWNGKIKEYDKSVPIRRRYAGRIDVDIDYSEFIEEKNIICRRIFKWK